MRSRLLFGISVGLVVAGSPAWAQTHGRSATDRDLKIELPGKKAAPSARKSCPEFGPGFVRVEGSTSCVRVGGGISVEGGMRR